VAANNLGGQGPDFAEARRELRLSGLTDGPDRRAFDLVITNWTEYAGAGSGAGAARGAGDGSGGGGGGGTVRMVNGMAGPSVHLGLGGAASPSCAFGSSRAAATTSSARRRRGAST